MKTSKLFISILALAVLALALPIQAWAADDGGALFKAKCAMCHGADAAGKPAMKAPSLIADQAKKMSDADLTDAIANGGKAQKPTHAFAKKGVTADQTKAIVAYIRSLQK